MSILHLVGVLSLTQFYMPVIKLETIIKAPIEVVFDLSRSIDLHMISTEHTDEKAIAGRTSGLLELGETVTWQAKHLGVYQKLKVKMTQLEFPNSFQDEMLKGAFKYMRHKHFFLSSKAGTIMRDEFDYKSPLGVLGQIVDKFFLGNYMRGLLLKRNETIKDFAETEKWKQVLNERGYT